MAEKYKKSRWKQGKKKEIILVLIKVPRQDHWCWFFGTANDDIGGERIGQHQGLHSTSRSWNRSESDGTLKTHVCCCRDLRSHATINLFPSLEPCIIIVVENHQPANNKPLSQLAVSVPYLAAQS